MGTRRLGVVALGRASAEDRLGRGLELGLGFELLVGADSQLLHRSELAALLDPHRSLLLGHVRESSAALGASNGSGVIGEA